MRLYQGTKFFPFASTSVRTYATRAVPQKDLEPRPPRATSLAGTVPYHTSYLLLESHVPPSEWPSVFASRLYFDIQRRIKATGGLVNFCWPSCQQRTEPAEIYVDGEVSGENYGATFWNMDNHFSIACRTDVPVISAGNVEDVLRRLLHRIHTPTHKDMRDIADPGLYFFVCTHGARDCRCGVRGGELAEALRQELRVRGMLFDRKGKSRIGEVAHVGGHKNAPNMIVFPHGDWYGNLEPSDLPQLLDYWSLRLSQLEQTDFPRPSSPGAPNHLQWRGCMSPREKVPSLT